MEVFATIYFVDVGQGTSQVVLFPDSSVVVIDCGRSSIALNELLESIQFDSIRALILSHWHPDHTGGAIQTVRRFADRIDSIYLSEDRPVSDIVRKTLFAQLKDLSQNESRFKFASLYRHPPIDGAVWPHMVFPDRATLKILYPGLSEKFAAQGQSDANQGSGILMLECGSTRVLFPGDAGKMAFEALMNRDGGNQRLKYDLIAAPHHCGKLSKSTNEQYPGYQNCFEWLYSAVLETAQLIVSAGTGNTYPHPREAHLQAAIQSGASIVCTQITPQCHADPGALGLAVLQPANLPASCGSGSGVGCAGTIQVDVTKSGVELHRFQEHQDAIDSKLDASQAMCRKLRPAGLA